MQICTLLTIRPPQFRKSSLQIVSFKKIDMFVLCYFLKLKVSFLSCIFLAKYIIHSIVKHLMVLALTSYTPPPSSTTTTTKEKYTIMEKKTLGVTRPNKIAKLQNTTGIKENKGQTIVRNRIFSPFLEYEMYNGFIQSPKMRGLQDSGHHYHVLSFVSIPSHRADSLCSQKQAVNLVANFRNDIIFLRQINVIDKEIFF